MQEAYLEEALREVGLEVGAAEAARLAAYAAMVVEAGRRMNLTGARSWEELVDRHIVDCLVGISKVDWSGVGGALDVGSGAGLPGIPLAIIRPEVKVGLVEARQKKAEFLRRCVGRLKLENALVVRERAEVLGRRSDWREKEERVLARGVAPLAVLLEYCLPLLAEGGWLVAWKGPGVDQELTAAQVALAELGGRVGRIYGYRLKGGRERRLVLVEKVAATPAAYPRRPGIGAKRPLGV